MSIEESSSPYNRRVVLTRRRGGNTEYNMNHAEVYSGFGAELHKWLGSALPRARPLAGHNFIESQVDKEHTSMVP